MYINPQCLPQKKDRGFWLQKIRPLLAGLQRRIQFRFRSFKGFQLLLPDFWSLHPRYHCIALHPSWGWKIDGATSYFSSPFFIKTVKKCQKSKSICLLLPHQFFSQKKYTHFRCFRWCAWIKQPSWAFLSGPTSRATSNHPNTGHPRCLALALAILFEVFFLGTSPVPSGSSGAVLFWTCLDCLVQGLKQLDPFWGA